MLVHCVHESSHRPLSTTRAPAFAATSTGWRQLNLDFASERLLARINTIKESKAGSGQEAQDAAARKQAQQQPQQPKRWAKYARHSTDPCQLPNSCLQTLPSGQGGATAVAFSPGGCYLAAACADAGNRFRIVVGGASCACVV